MHVSPSQTENPCCPVPFGARFVRGKGTFFRLWAPAARNVELHLFKNTEKPAVCSMGRGKEGCFEFFHEKARPGDCYLFHIDRKILVPDPASRYQARDIHGPSVICDPMAFDWQDREWQGRPWEEVVIYELHVGTFSGPGTFQGVQARLDYLADLGVTAVELMPVAHFPGSRNWGYDGALLFAPYNGYGTPDDFKQLVQAAHKKGIMVFLDVVYNHFGPVGNYLYVYARDEFFTDEYATPWGAAIRFHGKNSRYVRGFYIANALYWLEEFHLDGLRVDAAHTIFDASEPDILQEIALAVQNGPGRLRNIHLIIENDNNATRYLERKRNGHPQYFTAQWNDDYHHALHVLLTDDSEGYYADYSVQPVRHLARCLTEGYAYQGERSGFRAGKIRGSPSSHLPSSAFVSFLQNHDQVGNRAFGERMASICGRDELGVCMALLLLAPQSPLLFMGEEFGSTDPFCFFCDFRGELARSVTAGRRSEAYGMRHLTLREIETEMPDPNAESTFQMSKLDWSSLNKNEQREFFQFCKGLLKRRREQITPLLKTVFPNISGYHILGAKALFCWWKFGEDVTLSLLFNLHRQRVTLPDARPEGKVVFSLASGGSWKFPADHLPPCSICWFLARKGVCDG